MFPAVGTSGGVMGTFAAGGALPCPSRAASFCFSLVACWQSRAGAALKAGGEIMTVDALADNGEDKTSTSHYHLGLALRTDHGRVYSCGELTDMLGDEYESPRLIQLESLPRVGAILLARAK